MRFTLSRTKKIWLAAIFAVLLTGIVLSPPLLGFSGSSTRHLERAAISPPPEKPELDLAEAIRKRESWLLQTPISYEEAVEILGGSPGGNLLSFNIMSGWFEPLGKTYYSFDMTSTPPDPYDFLEVIQIWYKPDTSTPQYIVIRQSSAEAYRNIFPHQKDGISFHTDLTVQLGDGTLVGILSTSQDMEGAPFTPEWVQHKWFAEWIVRDIRHSVVGTNLDSHDILRIVEDLSNQSIK